MWWLLRHWCGMVHRLPSSDAASDQYRHGAPVCEPANRTFLTCCERHSFSWCATVRGGHDDIGEGWSFASAHRMLRQPDTNMTRVCASNCNSRHFDVSCSLPLCRESLRAKVCGGHDGIGEGWCFTGLFWMLRPTNTGVAHLYASQPCFTDVLLFL